MKYHVNDVIKLGDTPMELGLILAIDSDDEILTVYNLANQSVETLLGINNYNKSSNSMAIHFIKNQYKRYVDRRRVDSYMLEYNKDNKAYLKSITDLFEFSDLKESEITRICTCLIRNSGINTVLDLLSYSPSDLKHIRNLGKKTYINVVSTLHKYCALEGIEPVFSMEEYMCVL